jgi:hypothetical protein
MSTCNCLGLEILGSRPIMSTNLPGHWVVDVGGGFEFSPRGDSSVHSIERDTSYCCQVEYQSNLPMAAVFLVLRVR